MAVTSRLPSPPGRPAVRWVLVGSVLLLALGLGAGLWWWDGASPPDATGYGPGGPYLYVLQQSAIELVDQRTGAVAGRLTLKGEKPHAAALARDGSALLALSGKRMLALSTADHRVVSLVSLSEVGRRVAVSPGGKMVAVSVVEDPAVRLYQWDGSQLSLSGTLYTGGEPGALLYDDQGSLYVGLEDAVIALNPETGVEVFRAPLPKPHQKDPVRRIVRGSDGVLYAYYINGDHLGAIAVISPSGNRTDVHEMGRVIHDIALSPDGQTLYATWRTPVGETPRRGGLLALDPKSMAPKRPEIALGWAMGVAVSPDGRNVYVTEARRPFRWTFEFPGKLVRIDTALWQVADRQSIGRLPQAMAANH